MAVGLVVDYMVHIVHYFLHQVNLALLSVAYYASSVCFATFLDTREVCEPTMEDVKWECS